MLVKIIIRILFTIEVLTMSFDYCMKAKKTFINNTELLNIFRNIWSCKQNVVLKVAIFNFQRKPLLIVQFQILYKTKEKNEYFTKLLSQKQPLKTSNSVCVILIICRNSLIMTWCSNTNILHEALCLRLERFYYLTFPLLIKFLSIGLTTNN